MEENMEIIEENTTEIVESSEEIGESSEVESTAEDGEDISETVSEDGEDVSEMVTDEETTEESSEEITEEESATEELSGENSDIIDISEILAQLQTGETETMQEVPFMVKSLNDYTVTEGLLVFIALLVLWLVVLKMFE